MNKKSLMLALHAHSDMKDPVQGKDQDNLLMCKSNGDSPPTQSNCTSRKQWLSRRVRQEGKALQHASWAHIGQTSDPTHKHKGQKSAGHPREGPQPSGALPRRPQHGTPAVRVTKKTLTTIATNGFNVTPKALQNNLGPCVFLCGDMRASGGILWLLCFPPDKTGEDGRSITHLA